MSFAREAERAKGIRAKRNSFIVENFNRRLASFSLEGFFALVVAFLDLQVLLSTVSLACVAPLFYTTLTKLIKA